MKENVLGKNVFEVYYDFFSSADVQPEITERGFMTYTILQPITRGD